MKTTLIYTVAESDSAQQVQPTGMYGYAVTIAVTEALNITDKIFIMQREVPRTQEPDAYLDTFYSIASVPQLEILQQDAPGSMDQPFYRTNTITLVFARPDELQVAVDKIKSLIARLVKANDAVINFQAAEKSALPIDTLARFWGLFLTVSPVAADIQAMTADDVYSQVIDKTIVNGAGPRYIIFACRVDLPVITTLMVNGVSAPFASTTLSLTNPNGYTASYRVYHTTGTFSTGNLRLVTT